MNVLLRALGTIVLFAVLSSLFLVWLSGGTGPLEAFLGTLFICLLSALVARSWWTVVALPLAMLAALEIGLSQLCQGCVQSQDDTRFVRFLLNLPFYGLSALIGALLGTLISRRLFRMSRGSPVLPNDQMPDASLR